MIIDNLTIVSLILVIISIIIVILLECNHD